MRLVGVITSLLLLATATFSIYQIVIWFSNISTSDSKTCHDESLGSVVFECKENVTKNSQCFGLVMITRHEWLAQPSLNQINKLDFPVRNIILTDTKTEECLKKSHCNYLIRALQDDHNLNTDDIAYNFLISSQGDIYEGRGWLIQSAEVSKTLAKTSYLIGAIGHFTHKPVPEIQLKAMEHFIFQAKSVGKLFSSVDVYCSKDLLIGSNLTSGMVDSSFKYEKCLNKY